MYFYSYLVAETQNTNPLRSDIMMKNVPLENHRKRALRQVLVFEFAGRKGQVCARTVVSQSHVIPIDYSYFKQNLFMRFRKRLYKFTLAFV